MVRATGRRSTPPDVQAVPDDEHIGHAPPWAPGLRGPWRPKLTADAQLEAITRVGAALLSSR